MKYIRMFFREIKSSKARFFAIAAIFALGVGFYSGLGSTMPVMKKSMDKYADDYNLYDIKLLSEYGFDISDVETVNSVSGVENTVLSKSADALVDGGAARFMSLTSGVNGLRLLEGRLPENAGECVIGRNKMSGNLAEVGETITLSADNSEDTLNMFKTNEFTVVGIAESPVFPSVQRGAATVGQGALHHYVYISESDFDTDYYTEAYITISGAREEQLYTEEYDALINAAVSALENSNIANVQLERIKVDAQSELDASYAEYESERDKAYSELENAKAKLDSAKTELDSAKAQISDGERALAQGKASAAMAGADMLPALQAQLDASEKELETAREEYQRGLERYQSSLAEYNEQKANAQTELENAKAELDDAQSDIDALEAPEIYVTTLDDNYGVKAYSQDAERINNIAKVFPIMFFIVAALVCLTTMTRMIDEQRTKIGTLSALGYGRGAIAAQYLAYSLSAALIGGIIGIAIGNTVIPFVIFNTYKILYSMPGIVLTVDIPKTAVAFATAFVLTAAVTLWAALDSLRACAAQLMRPAAPKSGKKVVLEHVGFLWKRMSFTSKVTCRNILRYKKRFFMTVLGIAGCCALLLTGFGLKDSISRMIPEQYGRIQNFDMTVYLARDSAEVRECINQNSDSRIFVQSTSSDAKSDTESLECYIFVPEEPSELCSFIDLHERKSGEKIEFPPDGCAVIAEKLSTRLDIGVGDTVSVKRGEGDYVQLTVSGITENYIYNYVYMSPKTYEQAFEKAPQYNEVLVKSSDPETAGGLISENEDVASIMRASDMMTNFSNIFDSLNGVVLLLIVSACLLNFVVLYNLTNINIGERVREIATIKVLGFYPHETDAYIYRENIVLTLVGTALGLVLGRYLHGFVITTAEIDMIMFTRSISVQSFILSAVLTFVFSTLVNFFMHFKLKAISMTESLKSIE